MISFNKLPSLGPLVDELKTQIQPNHYLPNQIFDAHTVRESLQKILDLMATSTEEDKVSEQILRYAYVKK